MTLEPPPDHPTHEALALRRALGAFPTGVCVVTTATADGGVGVTINSFTSVSLEPPLVLWCLDERSGRWPVFADAESFSIHVLDADGETVARRFARGASGLDAEAEAALARAVTRLDCVVHQHVPMGDHMIIVGRVLEFQAREGEALTFHRGRYGRTAEDAE